MNKIAKRSKNDTQWQEVKRFVFKRDKFKCRFLSICTIQEYMRVLQKASTIKLQIFDPCHVFPSGLYPKMTYNVDNVYVLCRWVHDCLDECKNPVTGKHITQDERNDIWKRIIGEETYTKLYNEAFSIGGE